MSKPIVALSSGGKDSIAAVAELIGDPAWRVATLLTTYDETSQRVGLHGTPLSLIEAQAKALDLPLVTVGLPEDCSNAVYEERVADALKPLKKGGIRNVAIGDLHLDDIRAWREAQFGRLGITPHFPLWGRDSGRLASQLIAAGWRAVVCCVDAEQLDPKFLGRAWDADLLGELGPAVDPCGENGEFHTFVFDGPLFERPVAVRSGRRWITHGRFHMLDLLPA